MSVRFYQTGDEAQINALFKKVFHKKRPDVLWMWKYIDNPNSSNPWILVYEENGQIIGHISLWVSDAYVDGSINQIGLRMDTMVDPDARGKGIYKMLNERMLLEARKSGIAYLYGFPAAEAKDLLVKYTGGVHVADITRYVLMLKPSAAVSAKFPFLPSFKSIDRIYRKWKIRKIKRSNLNAETIEVVDYCDEGFEQLAEKLKNKKSIIVKRDAAYLNWRYINHPVNDYKVIAARMNKELLGYVVMKIEKRQIRHNRKLTIGFIIDYLAMEDETLEYLVEHAILFMRDVDMIQTWSLLNNSNKSLVSIGFQEKDKPMPLIVHDIAGGNEKYKSQANWWVMQGDVDSF